MKHTIRPFDFTDHDYQAAVTLRNKLYPDIPSTVEIWKHNDRSRRQDPSYHFFVAENQKGELTAFAQCAKAGQSSPKFSMGLVVEPKGWENGTADHLLEYVSSVAMKHQATALIIKIQESDSKKLSFLAKQGFKTVMRYPLSTLDVSSFDEMKWNQTKTINGITISQLKKAWHLNPEQQKFIYELDWQLMQDVPHHETREKKSFNEFLDEEIFHPNSLPESMFNAWDKNQAVGMTYFVKRGGTSRTLATAITGVLPNYRRKGIATALKIASIKYAKSIGSQTITTNNEESNPMFLLNQKLGFTTKPPWLDFQLTF